jgi:hypothetical protein
MSLYLTPGQDLDLSTHLLVVSKYANVPHKLVARDQPLDDLPKAVLYGGRRLTRDDQRDLLDPVQDARGITLRDTTLDGIFCHVDDLPTVLIRGQHLSRRTWLWALRTLDASGKYALRFAAVAVILGVPALLVAGAAHWYGWPAAAGLGAGAIVGVLTGWGLFK